MSSAWLAFTIDRHAKTPVFEQICEAVRDRILGGDLSSGAHLPPTRSLATELGVSRSTVVSAYDQLVAEGYIQGRRGSGFTVCQVDGVELRPTPEAAQVTAPLLDTRSVPFSAGEPDMRLFPHRAWAQTLARLCRKSPELLLAPQHRFGHPGLRAAIAAHVQEWRGVQAHPDQIIVTAGAGDALELCFRELVQAGETVALEDPGYRPLFHMVQANGCSVEAMPLDEQGALVPTRTGRMSVITPSHQFPLGGTMSPNRRHEHIQWADATGGWIIEDDYDSEFRYSGRPIPAMAGFDGLNRTIYVGSFSKIFSDSLRLGYVIVPSSIRDRMFSAMARFGRKASVMPQVALAEFMTSGAFYRHLRRVRRIYGQRRNFLLGALQRDFAEFGTFTDHRAGMQVAFRMDPATDDQAISDALQGVGLKASALSQFFAGSPTTKGLLLGYCGNDEDEMKSGLDRLLRVLKDRN
jgi:GntR family transcriptional regulator/MocR family aminotransferase